MIRFIKGIVVDIEENFLILENHGIGYRIFTPASVLERYVRVGEEIKLHTYMKLQRLPKHRASAKKQPRS